MDDCFFGGPEEIRTPDPYNANVMRSQLRYGPKYAPIITPPKTKVKPKVPLQIHPFLLGKAVVNYGRISQQGD